MRCLQHSRVRLDEPWLFNGQSGGRGPVTATLPVSVGAMNPIGEKTSTDVFELLSILHEQLDREEKLTLGWRRDIEDQLRRLEEQLNRIELGG
jgi:hypothetical protein